MSTKPCIVYCGPQKLSLVWDDVVQHGGIVTDWDERSESQGAVLYCTMPEDRIAEFVEHTEEEAIVLEEVKN